jgi:N utilization substance protein A
VNAKGASIGEMGSRVRAVMTELNDEKIDIVEHAEDPAQMIANALSPAKTVSVEVLDADQHSARAVVPEHQLSLAIGKEGMNARLAARLTGWRIDIKSESTFASEEERDDYSDELEGGVARCSHILQNGRRCPNAVLPGTRHCGLPGHDQPQAEAPAAPEGDDSAEPADSEAIEPAAEADVAVEAVEAEADADGVAVEVAEPEVADEVVAVAADEEAADE